MEFSGLAFAVLDSSGFTLSIGLKVVSKNLLKENREASNSAVVDPLNFVAHQVFRSVAKGYHQFAQGRLVSLVRELLRCRLLTKTIKSRLSRQKYIHSYMGVDTHFALF